MRIIQETTPLVSITVSFSSYLFKKPFTEPSMFRSIAQAPLAPDTTLWDVFFGFYSWFDNHPAEALPISMNYEGNTGTLNDFALQARLYDIFESELAKKYWLQTNGQLGTLGQARRKMTPLQRFTCNLLISGYWHLPRRSLPLDAGTEANIATKFQALSSHLTNATTLNPDQLCLGFASAKHSAAVPAVHKIMALGDGTSLGVNQRLLPWLQGQKGKRVGDIMLDLYDAVPGLVEGV